MFESNTWNYLIVYQQMSSGLFKNRYLKCIPLQIIYLIYMYREDSALNNLQGLICRKT